MNIFDSLIPATSGTAPMKGASLSLETENLEFAFLMGQSMQVQEGELIQALPNQEIMSFTIDGADVADGTERIDAADDAVLVFAGNNERIFAGMENKDLPAGIVRSNKFAQLTADTELLLFPTENKEMTLININQEEDSEIVENLLQSKSGDKKQAITIIADDSVKLSFPKASLNKTQSEPLPGLSDVDSQKDPHRQLTAYLKNLNAKEVLINDKLQPEKTVTESVVPLLESDQMESFVRSNIKKADAGNSAVVSISKESDKVSREIVLPVGEERLSNGDMMKKQNVLVIEKEANAQKGLEQKSELTKFDSLFKTGNVDSLNNEAGNSAKTNLSNMQPLTQLRTSTDGHITETVKIVLPENFKLNTNQKTQTIMIRIEPDHLGPARLELKMTDDFLSAKLIVETVEAKIILESSISQLKEKLASADIKVENLEINVRSESSNSHMSDKQQAHWQNQKAIRQFNRLDESLVSNEPAAMDAPINLRPQYAGAGGVNLLA
ncbi:MAG: flagellar hook-length control protein FliK [candidate division Zixibacteria bacterium]|nr:flagellar hook-length control protein FliK [candidate division Zixibacteria bacterium]